MCIRDRLSTSRRTKAILSEQSNTTDNGRCFGTKVKTVIQDTYEEPANEGDGVRGNSGLTRTSNNDDGDESDDGARAGLDGEDFDSNSEDEHEYGSEDGSIDSVDDLSDSDASDLSNHYNDHHATLSDDDGPEEFSSKRQPSPELGTPSNARSAPALGRRRA